MNYLTSVNMPNIKTRERLNTSKQQVSFKGYQDFVEKMTETDIPKTKADIKGRIASAFPLIFKDMTTKDASQIYDAMANNNGSNGQNGLTNFLTATSNQISPEKRVSFINALQNGIKIIKKGLPLGTIERKEGNVIVTSYDNEEGKAATIKFPESNRNFKVFGPETDVKTFLKESFGDKRMLKICPVGWTVPDTQILYETNNSFKELIDEIETKLKASMDTESPEFEKKFAKAKKLVAGEFYEAAFKQFWEPIDKEIFGKSDTPFSREDLGMVTSASYAGIDKAAMDYAKDHNIPTANIIPFVYARWMDDGTNCPYPLLVTNTVDDYANACAEAADILLVTGGRDHSYSKDFANFMVKEDKVVIPVDIMKEVFNYSIPAISRGKIANAAARLIEKGLEVKNLDIAKNGTYNNDLTETQNHVANAIKNLLKQRTYIDPDQIVGKVLS